MSLFNLPFPAARKKQCQLEKIKEYKFTVFVSGGKLSNDLAVLYMIVVNFLKASESIQPLT